MTAKAQANIDDAVATVRGGGLIAYPTEAVYGLGCAPRCDDALQRIIDIKGRAAHKGFILVAANQQQLGEYIGTIRPEWQRLLDAQWPGPVTFVVPAAKGISTLLTGGRDSVAVRVSAHPTIQALCLALGDALVSTSANRSQHPPLRTADSVRAEFATGIGTIVDGEVGKLENPTRIFDIASGQQLRS